jgi:hypothetical protein
MDNHLENGGQSHFPQDKSAEICYTDAVLNWLQEATGWVYGDIPIRSEDHQAE